VSAAGRLLGVDYGDVRVGLAVSDPDRKIAFPLAIYTRQDRERDAGYFRAVVKEEEAAALVIGLPVHLSGVEGQKAGAARTFGAWLAETFAEAVTGPPVLQVITGLGETGAALCRARIDKLAFTGSAATAQATIQSFSFAFFVPVYFAIVGLKLDLIHQFDIGFFAVFLAYACAVKAFSVYGGARLAGERRDSALNLAVALNARGGPAIVLASVALDAHVIAERFYVDLVLLALVTSMLAGAWLDRVLRRGTFFENEVLEEQVTDRTGAHALDSVAVTDEEAAATTATLTSGQRADTIFSSLRARMRRGPDGEGRDDE